MTPAIMSQSDPFIIDPRTPYGSLLSHPRVREFLVKSLTKHDLPLADAEDIVSRCFEALWRRRLDADPPNNLPRLIGLARKVLEGKLFDYFREKAHHEENLAVPEMPEREDGREGAPDGPDQPNFVDQVQPTPEVAKPGPDEMFETREQLTFVQEKLANGTITPDDIEVMQAEQAGEKSLEQMAAERNVPAGTLRSRISRIRKALREEWASLSLRSTTTIIVMILMFLLLVTLAVAVGSRYWPRPEPPQDTRDAPRTRTLDPVPPPPAPDKPSSGSLKPPVNP